LYRRLVGTKRTHPMSEGGSQEDDRSNKEGDTDSIEGEPNPGNSSSFLSI